MAEGLFRREVADAKQKDEIGVVHLAIPTSRWVFSLLIASVALSLVILAFVGKYTRRIQVTGTLVPAAGVISLPAKTQGEVARIMVRQGDHVTRGQPLIEFDNSLVSTVLGSTHDITIQQLHLQQKGYEHNLEVEKNLSTGREHSLRQKIGVLHDQLRQIEDQLKIQTEDVNNQEQNYKITSELIELKYISRTEMDRYQAALLSSRQQMKQLLRQRLEILQQIREAEQQMTEIPLNLFISQTETKNRLADLEKSLVQIESERSWILNSPSSGLVSTVLVKSGQVVSPGKPMVSLLPEGGKLEAQIFVPSEAIGFITAGQRVIIRYRAFPYQKYGQYYGKVKDVSSNALTAEEIESLGQKSSAAAYRVQVVLDDQHIQKGGVNALLRPGMELEADIVQDRRSLIEYVFEPIIGFGRKATDSSDSESNKHAAN